MQLPNLSNEVLTRMLNSGEGEDIAAGYGLRIRRDLADEGQTQDESRAEDGGTVLHMLPLAPASLASSKRKSA